MNGIVSNSSSHSRLDTIFVPNVFPIVICFCWLLSGHSLTPHGQLSSNESSHHTEILSWRERETHTHRSTNATPGQGNEATQSNWSTEEGYYPDTGTHYYDHSALNALNLGRGWPLAKYNKPAETIPFKKHQRHHQASALKTLSIPQRKKKDFSSASIRILFYSPLNYAQSHLFKLLIS